MIKTGGAELIVKPRGIMVMRRYDYAPLLPGIPSPIPHDFPRLTTPTFRPASTPAQYRAMRARFGQPPPPPPRPPTFWERFKSAVGVGSRAASHAAVAYAQRPVSPYLQAYRQERARQVLEQRRKNEELRTRAIREREEQARRAERAAAHF